jgi:hypothetical protein
MTFLSLIAILQEETTGENTSVIQGAANAAQDIPRETGDAL